MIEYKNDPIENWIEIHINGNITKDDGSIISARLEDDIQKHRKIRVIEVIRNFEGFDPVLFWQDARFGMKYIGDITHLALVADAQWLETLAPALGMFVSTEVRTFHLEELDEARQWLKKATLKTP